MENWHSFLMAQEVVKKTISGSGCNETHLTYASLPEILAPRIKIRWSEISIGPQDTLPRSQFLKVQKRIELLYAKNNLTDGLVRVWL